MKMQNSDTKPKQTAATERKQETRIQSNKKLLSLVDNKLLSPIDQCPNPNQPNLDRDTPPARHGY